MEDLLNSILPLEILNNNNKKNIVELLIYKQKKVKEKKPTCLDSKNQKPWEELLVNVNNLKMLKLKVIVKNKKKLKKIVID